MRRTVCHGKYQVTLMIITAHTSKGTQQLWGLSYSKEKEGVFLSLLKLCSRTLINEELLSLQIYGNLEKHVHVRSRGENVDFQRHVHLSLIYVSISVSKF